MTPKGNSIFRKFSISIALMALCACGGGGGGTVVTPAPTPTPPPSATAEIAQIWVTTGDKSRLLDKGSDIELSTATTAPIIINVDAATTYQEFVGIGASLTDASTYLLQTKLSAASRDAIMNELFSKTGIGIDFTRLTIGASDFSQTHYSYDDMPSSQTDLELSRFSIDPARANLLPTIKHAQRINPNLKIMASPWSAPGWMKTSYKMVGGTLRPEFYNVYANYLVRYLEAMKAEGVDIFALTMQNEPSFSPTNYPGMIVTGAERANFYKNHLGPLLESRAPATSIMEWDHNWNLPAEPLSVLADADASKYISAVAWHCYGGSPVAQTTVHNAYPDKGTYFTECSGGQWDANFQSTLQWQTSNLIIGTTRNWAKGVLLWNIALDEKFGPHLGGCGDCRGVITINSQSGEITRNVEYYVLGHIGRFVQPQAKRIKSDSEISGIETVAFTNPNNGGKVIIVLNSNNGAKDIAIRENGQNINFSLNPHSVATIVWGK